MSFLKQKYFTTPCSQNSSIMYELVSLKMTKCHPVYLAHLLLEQNSKPFISWDIKMSQADLLLLELVSLNTFSILTPAPHTGNYLKFHFWNVIS